ncbi:hypothetical protein VPH35_055994 [Triticum aestivum]
MNFEGISIFVKSNYSMSTRIIPADEPTWLVCPHEGPVWACMQDAANQRSAERKRRRIVGRADTGTWWQKKRGPRGIIVQGARGETASTATANSKRHEAPRAPRHRRGRRAARRGVAAGHHPPHLAAAAAAAAPVPAGRHRALGRRVRAPGPRRARRSRALLRHHARRPAAVARRDLALPRRAAPPRAAAAAGVRARPRLAALARAQPRRRHRLPRGGPGVVPHRARAVAVPARAPRQVPHAPRPRRRPLPLLPELPLLRPRRRRRRGRPLAGPRQRRLPAGAAQPAAGGVPERVGHAHGGCAQGVLPVGARQDGGYMDGGGDGAGQARRGGHRRVPPRRGPQGGEDVRRGVPLREVPGGGDRPAVALQDPAGVTAERHGRRRRQEALLLTMRTSEGCC